MEILQLPKDGTGEWAGMKDYQLLSPDGNNSIDIKYVGEPPHGSSYHTLKVNGKSFPGYAWGCIFAFSTNSRYLICSWMLKKYERKTVVIDCLEFKFFELPEYIYNFRIEWPTIRGEGDYCSDLLYSFNGTEKWQTF